MTDEKINIFSQLSRYSHVFFRQITENREYLYFWLLATMMDIAMIEAIKPWSWLLISTINLVIGLIAIGTVVRPVDKAFESIGLDYSKGYGKPHWIVDGKYPLSQDILRVNAAGYTPADYERYIGQLASRLNQPIKEIRKPSAHTPVIEVVLRRSHLPQTLAFKELPLGELKPGEFFLGKSDDAFERLSLKSMIHMLVAGQTGAGKTQFLRQFMATLLTTKKSQRLSVLNCSSGCFQPSLQTKRQ
jgi:hypothetical protein